MAHKRQLKNGKWEFTVKCSGVLDKPIYQTFLTESEGDAYCQRLEALLDKGIIPTEHKTSPRVLTVAGLVREYERDSHPSTKDSAALSVVLKSRGAEPLHKINSSWVDAWISEMKRVDKNAPATIRAKVGALARAADWGVRKSLLTLPDHPFRTLPDGYAQYTKADAALAGVARVDVERDRRLEPGEFEKIQAVIAGGVLPRKQRPYKLGHTGALGLMVTLGVETAMRMREMYTLTTDQVDLLKRTVFLDKTKNGDRRQVPLSSVALAALNQYLKEIPPGRLFPWWDGVFDEKKLATLSDFLSGLFVEIFKASGCVDLKFHDLRHEATSRLFERTPLRSSSR